MKNFFKVLLCLLFISPKFVTAQEKYSTVKIASPVNRHERADLLGLLEVDHLHEENGHLTVQISEIQLARLRQTGYRYEVIVDDVVADLEQKNRQYFEDRARGLIGIDGKPLISFQGRVAFEQPGNTVGNIIPTPVDFQVFTGANNMGGYYTFAQMNTAMDALVAKYPNLATKTSIGTSIEGRNIWVIKISDNVATDEPGEPEVLYIGLQHAREAIGGSSMIFFMQYLCEQYSLNPAIKDLVDNREIFIIPCMNPDGWEYNRSTNPGGGGMWRKNRRDNPGNSWGVDLNRNWSVDWANCSGASSSCGSSTTTAETYWGTAAFSEPETNAVRNFVKTRQFVTMIDQHAYGPYYSLPFGRPSLHPQPDSLTLQDQRYFTHIPALMGKYNGMRAGNSPQSVGYEVAGGVKDWMMMGEIGSGTKGKIYGMTGEGGYGQNAGSPTFWPPASQIVNLCKGMVFQNLQLAYSAGSYVDIQDMSDIGVTALSGSFSFRLKRIGLADAPVTVTAIPLENINTVGSPVIVSSLPNYYDAYTGSVSFTLSPTVSNGQPIRFAWRVQTGGYTYTDTIVKIYNPAVLFTDDMESGVVGSKWTVSGGWNYVADSGYNASRALTESPGGTYSASSTRSAQYNGTLDLSDATAAFISFQVRHRAENFRDKLQLQVSTNGSSWTAIAGKTTVQEPGTLEGSTINGNPSLTGIRDDWASEVFSLASYLGQSSVYFRFVFTSDGSGSFYASQDEGFYIDNLKAIKATGSISTLPVTLIGFRGTALNGNNRLEWIVGEEQNFSHYVLERSEDGIRYTTLTAIPGAKKPSYQFTDYQPVAENYYRLKMVDLDSRSEYSPVVLLRQSQAYPRFVVNQNPFRDRIVMQYRVPERGTMLLQLHTASGALVHRESMELQPGAGFYTIGGIARLTPGIYFLRLLYGQETETIRLLKH